MRPVNLLVWHCTATPEGKDYSVADVRKWHLARGFSDIGYHYLVHIDGRVEAGRPLDQVGAHVQGHNTGSIGCSYVGGVDADNVNKAEDTRTPAQKKAMLALTRKLVKDFPGIVRIAGHNEFANKASSWTGGSDGLSGIAPTALLGLYEFDLWGRTAYVFGVALLAVVFVVLRLIVRSPFGMLCRGIKEDPIRIRSMGASPKIALTKMYVISGAVAGVGGALNAISTQVVGLDSLSFTMSAESLVMLVLGGTGSLFGALTGTVVFMFFEDVVSAANPFHWLTMVGALLIAVVLFAPKGIYGTAAAFFARRKEAQ